MSDETGAELVMPFIVTHEPGEPATTDRPYDSASFVAGARFQQVWHQLANPTDDAITAYVEPALLPQLDLAAMHFGYRIETEPWDEHPDEWVLVSFTRCE